MDAILITGGSGFLGINLVRHLLDRGWRGLRTLDIAAFDYPERILVDAREGDVRDPAAVRAAMAGVRTVVHCAAALPRYHPREIWETDVLGTEVVLAEAVRAGVERVVVISSTAVYGVPERCPIVEDAPLDGVGPYGRAKVEAERRCALWRSRGLTVSVLRPKTFIGPERLGVFALLYEWAHEGRSFPVIGNGRNPYQLLDVEDLCQAIRACLEGPAGEVSDTFNVAAMDFGSLRDGFQAVLDEAGRGRRVVPLPAGPTVLALRTLDRLGISPLYPWVYETAGKASHVSIDRIRQRLGWIPRFSNDEALVRNYRWYVAHRSEVREGVSHRSAWRPGVLRYARIFF